MKIYYSSKFEREYRRLPKRIKLLAEKREQIFRKDPFNAQLKTHRLKGRLKEYWSFSIDLHYRMIFEFVGKDIVWLHSVGTHSIYD